MNKVLVFITLFVGILMNANKTEATVKSINIFKGMETLQNSPWDPHEESKSSDDTGTESPPEDSGVTE